MSKRIVIAEEIAEAGLDRLRSAGFNVDVQLDKSATELHTILDGAHALIVRSATMVDAAMLAAGKQLVVVARAGVGLDNIDVEAATKQGVMVVNAPQSNVLSAAEHTMALILSIARNVPQAHSALTAGRWERSKWEGIELAGKTLGILGLGRIGTLVAQRARAFDMRLVAYDPFVSAERGRELGVEMTTLERVVEQADVLTIHLPKNKETTGIINADMLKRAKRSLRIVNVARGGIADEADLAEALRNGTIAGAALDVFTKEPVTDSPLFDLGNIVVTPHLGASTREAQDRAGEVVADMVQLALNGDFVPFAVNLEAGDANETLKPFVPLADRIGRVFASLIESTPSTIEISTTGEIGGYDPGLITISALKGMLSVWSTDQVSLVNAPSMARNLNITVESVASTTTTHRDYVNLITLRSGDRNIAATLTGRRREARIVMIDHHLTDIPPSEHMLVVKNDDRPGAIGRVATALGNAGINIANMDVGSSETVGSALMCIATTTAVPLDVLQQLRTLEGISSVVSVGA
ncbi:MAG: phosphoglycerate dehydrogenase [Actinobacteria bacterium]|nr:phosphoglycerate dehydrogenase [Actinomycetota bacterium]